MKNFADWIAADPSVAPALRQFFASPRKDLLADTHDRRAPRRFSAEPVPITGFDILDPTSERSREVGDEERALELADLLQERNEAGD